MWKRFGTAVLALTLVTLSACSTGEPQLSRAAETETTLPVAVVMPPTSESSTDGDDPSQDITSPPDIVNTGSTQVIENPSMTGASSDTGEEPGSQTEAPEDTKPDGSGETGSEDLTDPEEPEDPKTEEIPSNLPAQLKQKLDRSGNGLIFIYHPEKFKEIKAITRWTVLDYESESELLLVTKAKGSIVEIAKAELTDGEEVVKPGDVIRNWETTSDYEVIRIHFSDPETIPYNFIRVRQPDGKVTLVSLRTSMVDDYDWEAFKYQATE